MNNYISQKTLVVMHLPMDILPDTQNCGCACAGNAGNVFPRRRFQRKLLVSDPGMHHGTCVTHVPWCMSGSLTCGDGEKFPAFPAHAHPRFCVSGKRPMPCYQFTSICKKKCPMYTADHLPRSYWLRQVGSAVHGPSWAEEIVSGSACFYRF